MKVKVNQDNYVALGRRIKELRKLLKISQKDFATSLSMANSYLSEIEHGKANPAFEFFYKLSNVYNVNLNYLFQGIGELLLPRTEEKETEKQKEWIDEIETIEDLVWFMEHSSLVRHTVMGFAGKFLYDNETAIKKSIQKHKSGSKKRKDVSQG